MKLRLVILFLLIVALSNLAQEKLDRLMVMGPGFMFGVKEPTGWQADTDNASQMGANILFFKKGESVEKYTTLIYVRLSGKSDENVAGDLKWDMGEYKKRYRGIKFRDLQVSHPEYAIYPKVFTVPGEFYEYVTYVNPGKGKPYILSVAMNVQKVEASADELAAYKEVLSTLVLLSP